MPIWTSAYLSRLELEAEIEVAKACHCVVDRVALNIQSGVALYTVPEDFLGVRAIKWKGNLVRPLTRMEVRYLYPENTIDAFYNTDGAFEYSAFNPSAFLTNQGFANSGQSLQSQPDFYCFSGTSFDTFQFYGTPSENIASTTSNLWGTEIPNRVILEYYRLPDGVTFRIPEWTRKALIKDYVLWKAFLKEGPGQRIQLAMYYKQQFESEISIFKQLHSRIMEGQNYVYSDQVSTGRAYNGRAVYPQEYGIPYYE